MMEEITMVQAARPADNKKLEKVSRTTLRLLSLLLVGMVWLSAGLFGLYMLAFYAADWYGNQLENWNKILPGLYQREQPAANVGIGLHFATGGVILVLGSIQLVKSIRDRYPAVHRWIGRIYVVASLVAAVGGLLFIFLRGTIGGTVMDIGFGLYGVLMLIAAVQTVRYARAGRLDQHRAWAIRLYALAIGSWLFRMEHGFWYALTGHYGHTPQFTGGFDKLMTFFFYVPNLLVAEIFIRSDRPKTSVTFNFLASFVLLLLAVFLGVGTYIFTKMLWGPAIIDWIFQTDPGN
jgi:uncharacterized membrane protein